MRIRLTALAKYGTQRVDIHAVGSSSEPLLFPTDTLECEGHTSRRESGSAAHAPGAPIKAARKRGFMRKIAERESDLRDDQVQGNVALRDKEQTEPECSAPGCFYTVHSRVNPAVAARRSCRSAQYHGQPGQARGKSLLSDPVRTVCVLCIQQSWPDFWTPALSAWGSCVPRHARRRQPSLLARWWPLHLFHISNVLFPCSLHPLHIWDALCQRIGEPLRVVARNTHANVAPIFDGSHPAAACPSVSPHLPGQPQSTAFLPNGMEACTFQGTRRFGCGQAGRAGPLNAMELRCTVAPTVFRTRY